MSDHYTVLARRFRPQTFADVVGQEHVGRAIQNAIRAGRVAHAYLFTGARGVGKTSTARIFAKALNCPSVQDGIPCNACDVCDAIGEGADVDVLEIDGASNRGIDDIRQLRANVNIRSMRSPFKVYIIDEVHMLTKEAFNALLKTLEEPPPNVKFIFCTTEPQKVPDTILSRCQRFDFGTITTERIGDRLREIAQAEGIGVDDEAIAMVARRAAGSMRDSQSLFDQLLAFGGEHINADDVHRLFGTAPDERIVELMQAVLNGDRASALQMLQDALDGGVRLESLTDQLVAYVRDLMVLAAGAQSIPMTSVSDAHRQTLSTQADQLGVRTATAALQILADAKLKMARTVHGRPLLELAVIRLTLLEDLDGLAALVAAARSGDLGKLPDVSVKKKLSAEPAAAALAPAHAASEPAPPSSPHQSSPQPSNATLAESTVSHETVAHTVHPTTNVATPDYESQQTPPSPTVFAAEPAEARPTGPPKIVLSHDTFEEFWARLCKIAPDRLSNSLADSKSHELTDERTIRVTVGTEFSLKFLQSDPTRKRLDAMTAGLTGQPVPFEFVVKESVTAKPAFIRDRQQEPALRKKSAVEDDTFVQAAIEVFGGQLVQVKSVPLIAVAAEANGDDEDADQMDMLPVEEDDDA